MAKTYKTASRAYKTVARSMNTRVTPQSQKVPGKDQVMNNAGGAVFQISKWDYLMRFLILGSEGGTYYVGEQKLTRENAKNAESCIREDGKKVVDMVVEVSDAGRAPKNDPAIFVLAMAAGLGNEEVRKYALDNLHKVCRIGTHLFHFADYVQEFRGWGHGLRRAIGRWYTERPTDKLAMQLVKYQGRDGWTHRDLLRLAHPHVTDEKKNFALRWAVKGSEGFPYSLAPDVIDPLATIWAFEQVKKETDEKTIVNLVTKYGLPLEAIPTEKQTKSVLAAAIENLGITALIRNLGRYSKEGILTASSDETRFVVSKLLDSDLLKRGRVHPISVLTALMTYKSGHGMRGSSTWDVVSKLVDALDEAFYLSFGVVEPTGKRILLGLDVSGSMTSSFIGNLNMSARAASSAMAMVTARVEKNYDIIGFTGQGRGTFHSTSTRTGWGGGNAVSQLDISPRRRLDDIMEYTEGLPFGSTDCALPMLYASANGLKFDAFIIYTDYETWCGDIHPFQALKQYRDKTGINARLIVVGMTATEFSIADPSDKGMMDVVGFDTAAPNVISSFIRGEF